MNPNQEFFNKAATHLLRQMQKSVDETGLTCQYRGIGGLMCAVGALIPDGLYLPEFEGEAINRLRATNRTIETLFEGVSYELSAKVQHIHDQILTRNWAIELELLAARLKLKFNLAALQLVPTPTSDT